MTDTETILKAEHKEEVQEIFAFVDTLDVDNQKALYGTFLGYNLCLVDRQQEAV